MAWRRRRTEPSFTELRRVEAVLERDLATRQRLGPKKVPVKKRDGTVVLFASEALLVAKELMLRKANPERAHVRKVLLAAADILGIGRSP